MMSKGIIRPISQAFRNGAQQVDVTVWWGDLTPRQVADRLGCYCVESVGILPRGKDGRLIFSRHPLPEHRDDRDRITQRVIR